MAYLLSGYSEWTSLLNKTKKFINLFTLNLYHSGMFKALLVLNWSWQLFEIVIQTSKVSQTLKPINSEIQIHFYWRIQENLFIINCIFLGTKCLRKPLLCREAISVQGSQLTAGSLLTAAIKAFQTEANKVPWVADFESQELTESKPD